MLELDATGAGEEPVDDEGTAMVLLLPAAALSSAMARVSQCLLFGSAGRCNLSMYRKRPEVDAM